MFNQTIREDIATELRLKKTTYIDTRNTNSQL